MDRTPDQGRSVAKDFRELVVWEQAMALAERVYELTKELPGDERYGLVAQMRRAAVSVPSCIAEGNARASIPDYLRFVSMASGSLAELRTQTMLVARMSLASPRSTSGCLDQISRVDQLLKRLQSALRKTSQDRAAPRPSRFPFPVSPT